MEKQELKNKRKTGPGRREVSLNENQHPNKWKWIRWSFLLSINFFFFASYYFDIQLLEGTLNGSRLLGFHLEDLFTGTQIMLASRIVNINLIIGMVSVTLLYLIIGGRLFCSWVCPYHFLAELGEKLHQFLRQKKIIKRNYTFDKNLRYYFYALFLALSFFTGIAIFEVINPVGILSRAIVYGPGMMLVWVIALLAFEVFFSRRAWCRYLCPVGVSYTLIGFLAPLKIKWDINKCVNCKECQKVCMVPHVLKDTVNKGVTDYVNSGDCTRCGLCIDACDDAALKFDLRYLDKII